MQHKNATDGVNGWARARFATHELDLFCTSTAVLERTYFSKISN